MEHHNRQREWPQTWEMLYLDDDKGGRKEIKEKSEKERGKEIQVKRERCRENTETRKGGRKERGDNYTTNS